MGCINSRGVEVEFDIVSLDEESRATQPLPNNPSALSLRQRVKANMQQIPSKSSLQNVPSNPSLQQPDADDVIRRNDSNTFSMRYIWGKDSELDIDPKRRSSFENALHLPRFGEKGLDYHFS